MRNDPFPPGKRFTINGSREGRIVEVVRDDLDDPIAILFDLDPLEEIVMYRPAVPGGKMWYPWHAIRHLKPT